MRKFLVNRFVRTLDRTITRYVLKKDPKATEGKAYLEYKAAIEDLRLALLGEKKPE